MNKEKLEAKILNFAVENAKNPFPDTISYGVNSNANVCLDNTIFSQLEQLFVKNGVVSAENKTLNDETVNASRASAFAASAICQLFIADKIKKNIDLFVNDSQNDKYFDELNDEQKETFIRELKGKVTARLEVDTKTIYGEDLVQKLSDAYNKFAEKSKWGSDSVERFLGEGLGAVVLLNRQLEEHKNLNEAVDAVKKQYADGDNGWELDYSFQHMILDQIKDNSSQLAAEMTPDIDTSKSLWERICDFVKKLLGIEVTDDLQNEAARNRAENKKLGEKMSFGEFSGVNDIKKVKSPSPNHNDHAAERNAPTLGG